MTEATSRSDTHAKQQLFLHADGSVQLHTQEKQPRREKAFARSAGAGMLDLVVHGVDQIRDAAILLNLHELAKEALQRALRLLRQGKEETGLTPDATQSTQMLAAMPPCEGASLSVSILQSWFSSLEQAWLDAAARAGKSPEAYLAQLGEGWSQLGRLCLHLAENAGEQGEEKPFAFLATFVHRVGVDDKPRHMPLGLALRHYADDREALLALIRPLQLAAQAIAAEGGSEGAFIHELVRSQQIYQPCAWSARECHAFLLCLPALQKAGIETRVVNLWKTQPRRVELEVKLDLDEDSSQSKSSGGGIRMHSLLQFSAQLALGMQQLSEEEIAELMASEEGLIRFRGEWILMDAEKLKSLLDGWRQAIRMQHAGIPLMVGLRYLLGKRSDALAYLPDPDPLVRVEAGDALMQALESLQNQDIEPLISPEMRETLRPYQLEGVQFLLHLSEAGLGACLADDMGLGKSIQVVAWLSHLMRAGQLDHGAALLVAPASLLDNWREELKKFAPELSSIILHPDQLSAQEMKLLQSKPEDMLSRAHVALTSYGMATRLSLLSQLQLPALILDEAQAIKNAQSQRSQSILRLSAQRRVALSGTPVENSLQDLHSLFEFLNPGLLGTEASFRKMLREMGTDFTPLRRLIRPFILRRLKSDPKLLPDLPPRSEKPAYCRLSPEQARLYAREVEQMQALIHEPDPRTRLALILPLLTRFKQICNHPAQYLGEPHFAMERSGKMQRLADLLRQLAEQGEPALIFTQYRSMVEALMEMGKEIYGSAGLCLHGGTPISERQKLIRQFQQQGGPPFMILSLKAAGTGLTLTRARHVIHFDRWWNPAVENQASDRAHRLGQKRAVVVHPLICRGTIEENIHRMLQEKKKMADDLLQEGLEHLLLHLTQDELLDLCSLRPD